MKKTLSLVAALTLCGCNAGLTKQEQIEANKPFKISEHGGITIWKVRDGTYGGKSYIYYSTPSGHILPEDNVE